ncbi:MAG TPA: SprT-like domain-containing protein [Bacteroidia bacterium]
MSQFERNSLVLQKYIPEPAISIMARWIVEYDFKLKIKRERNTKLGDYRSPQNGQNHIITINYNLNKYAFLITLVHEVAHLVTFNKHKNSVNPHGEEWKQHYKQLMKHFLTTDFFPTDVLLALQKHLLSPAASSCSDANLLRILNRYDENNEEKLVIEKIPHKTVFKYNGNKLFEKGERIRSRYRCKEVSTGAIYLFHALAEVELVKVE